MKIRGAIRYGFTAKPWQYQGKASWYFISLPLNLAKEIRQNLKWQQQGWGRMKATAKIGNSLWDTAIWYDSKLKTYLLPLKSEIRIKEKISVHCTIKTIVWI